MEIHGWGRYTVVNAKVLEPLKISDIKSLIINNQKIIARGLGRSYGDSANNDTVIDITRLKSLIHFDLQEGIITCEAGMSIREINKLTIPKGWLIPVTPGSGYITLGGAIASDIHGKNHHLDGTFSQYVLSADLILGNGETIIISKNTNADLFKATCGGMGLTGIISSATIRLKAIRSNLIKQKTIPINSLEELCSQLEKNASSTYSVAWIDCLAKSLELSKSLLFLGEHIEDGELISNEKKIINLPTKFCSLFLKKGLIKFFNNIYYHKNLVKKEKKIFLENYFYPLDSLLNWNILYGKKGFIQYQFVIPKNSGIKTLKKILNIIFKNNNRPFLAVLKIFGLQNDNYLSFPIEGYTLALDFKVSNSLYQLINLLDQIIIDNGGRIYLAKDTLMTKETFRACYPKWDLFEQTRVKYKAVGKFTSHQSKRLGLL